MRQLGTGLGVSLFAALMTSRLGTGLNERLRGKTGASLSKDGSLSPEVLGRLSSSVRAEIADIYANSLRATFYAVIPIAAIGLVAALFLKDVKLADGHGHGSADSQEPGDDTATSPSAPRGES